MVLKRYNEILFAVLGTFAVLGLFAMAMSLMGRTTASPTDGIAISQPMATKGKQNLIVCPPVSVTGSDFEYFPVGVVVEANARLRPGVAAMRFARSQPFDRFCGGSYFGADARIFNAIVRNRVSGEQELILDGPAQIQEVTLPDPECDAGEGDVPCGIVLWKMRIQDTNHDSVINRDDALTVAVSHADAKDLRVVTPSSATVLASQWDPEANKFYFLIVEDTNGDGSFSGEDGSEILETSATNATLAQAVVAPSVMERLAQAVR